MSDKGNKTEKPTPRRIEKARKDGNLPNTRQLLSGFQFLIFVALMLWGLPTWVESIRRLTAVVFRQAMTSGHAEAGSVIYLTREVMIRAFLPLAGGGVLLVLATLALQLLATQFGISFKKLAPDLKKFNPVPKVKNVFQENLLNTVQALVLLPLFFYATYALCRDNIDTIVTLPLGQLPVELRTAGDILRSLLWKASLILTTFGVGSYIYAKHRYTKQLKMSRQEILDEHKDIEGNPVLRARLRGLRREFRQRGMLRQVPQATAVIVNPTHFAVALRYEMDSKSAPVVLAKGQDFLALKIREIAEKHGVPVVENKPLAQALYRSVVVGQEIPLELYHAVAEVLAYVYRVMMNRD